MWIPIEPMLVDTLEGPKQTDRIWFNGRQPTYEVTYEDGTSYEYTGNHQLLVSRGGEKVWTRVAELKDGDDIVTH
jgi:intein/homing endonuclease